MSHATGMRSYQATVQLASLDGLIAHSGRPYTISRPLYIYIRSMFARKNCMKKNIGEMSVVRRSIE